jgi:hypothetical protein
MRSNFLLAVAIIGCAACNDPSGFQCAANQDCVNGNGIVVSVCYQSYCAFSDNSCLSGFRYGHYSDGNSDACVQWNCNEDHDGADCNISLNFISGSMQGDCYNSVCRFPDEACSGGYSSSPYDNGSQNCTTDLSAPFPRAPTDGGVNDDAF